MLHEVRGVDAHMSAPFEICSKRSVVAVLASGVVISLTALTGGITPAFAKPDTDQVVTTTAPAPEPRCGSQEIEAPYSRHRGPALRPSRWLNRLHPVQASSVPSAPVATSASPTASVGSVPPSAALVAPSSAMGDMPPPNTSPVPGSESKASEPKVSVARSSSVATTTGGSTVSISEAAKVIEQSEPQTLQAPKADVELASNAKPVEVKTDPAPKQDVDAIASSIGLDLGVKGPLGVDASAKADARLASDRVRDRNIRQWSPDWVQYDDYYRPIILNPYHERVRIVYVYDNAPRIVWIPPLARAILEVPQFAAYSFTGVVDTAANLVNASVQTAANVAVGSFFGGGYVPAFGLPLPPPPPPVLRYDNVPVQVRYPNATYEPFRVRRIVDVGDDSRFGERKVLLDGATPAWGEWTQTPSGERQFEVHKTQQFRPDDPQEARCP